VDDGGGGERRRQNVVVPRHPVGALDRWGLEDMGRGRLSSMADRRDTTLPIWRCNP
jgi:hypothetical protein